MSLDAFIAGGGLIPFQALPDDRLMRRLADLDMAADEVPAVGIPLPERMAMGQQDVAIANREPVVGPCQKRSRPMAAPTMIVTTDSTSMGTKKLWSNNLPPNLVVPVRSKLAAAIWVPLAGSV